jgi:hypothetical protein
MVDRIEEYTKLQGLVKRFFEEVYELLSVRRLLLMIYEKHFKGEKE